MNDELDRIRSLRGDAPGPSDDWVYDTRAELLAMAAEEQERRVAAAPGPLARLRDRLAAFAAGPRTAAAAGVVALVAVVAIGAVLTTEPDTADPLAGTTAPPATTPSPDATSSPDLAASPNPTPSARATPSSQPGDQVVLASSCQGGDGTYTIGYPEGWHTNPGDVGQPCELFDTRPVELEPQTGGAPEQPVVVRVLPVALDRATDPGEAAQETSRRETTVAGRDAVVVQWTSTGEAAMPEGVRSYRYLVDLGGRTLMVAAYDLGDTPFATAVEVADAMVASLELTP